MTLLPRAAPLIVGQLSSLGVEAGGVLLVHTAFSQVRPVEGGPLGLVAALLAAMGPDGTLVMPSMADFDDQPFDPAATPCLGVGVVADRFWRLPGVLRSNNPHAFAARGPQAARITAPHPLDVPNGPDSPVGRVLELGGQVLLLGVGHDANTTIHLAEMLAGVRYRRPKQLIVLETGRTRRLDYAEIDHCCQNFASVDGWLEAKGLQQREAVGSGSARIMRSRDVVDAVVERLLANETEFLHPFGVCGECDEARGAIPNAKRA